MIRRFLSKTPCHKYRQYFSYPGAPMSRFTSHLERCIEENKVLPTFQVLSPTGAGTLDSSLQTEKVLKKHNIEEPQCLQILKAMISLRALDDTCLQVHRQGRIPFYAPTTGEEASVVASAAALEPVDEVYSQYREGGCLLYRLMEAGEEKYLPFLRQNVGSKFDWGRGVQMSMHYGRPEFHFQMVSSTVATQVPNAVGAAYALRVEKKSKSRIAAAYFGDGGSSTGDAHGALNMAATLGDQGGCPVLFLCRNNGFAISTPSSQQYRSDGLAGRACKGYGIAAYRVDGNDALATFVAVRTARDYVIDTGKPAFVELMTFRRGDHSTSDDSSRYRDIAKAADIPDPINRMANFCSQAGIWALENIEEYERQERQAVVDALRLAENEEKPPPNMLFEDVYRGQIPSLKVQLAELEKHMKQVRRSA